MKAGTRTVVGVMLFVPLALILLVTFACLPAPVGDPEQAKVDLDLGGAYRAVTEPGEDATTVVLLHPWDSRTYYLQYLVMNPKDAKDELQTMNMKAWLTKIGDHTFLTAQPMDDLKYAIGEAAGREFWSVFRLDKTAEGMEALMVNGDSEHLKGLTKREEFEAAIKAHASDKSLYGDPITFRRLGRSDQAFLEETLAKFHTKPNIFK